MPWSFGGPFWVWYRSCALISNGQWRQQKCFSRLLGEHTKSLLFARACANGFLGNWNLGTMSAIEMSGRWITIMMSTQNLEWWVYCTWVHVYRIWSGGFIAHVYMYIDVGVHVYICKDADIYRYVDTDTCVYTYTCTYTHTVRMSGRLTMTMMSTQNLEWWVYCTCVHVYRCRCACVYSYRCRYTYGVVGLLHMCTCIMM